MTLLATFFFICCVLLIIEHIKLNANIVRYRILRAEDPKGILQIKLYDLVKLFLIKRWEKK